MLIAREDIAKEIDKGRLPFNVTYPTQVIAKVVLTEGLEFIKSSVGTIKKERERVIKELEKIEGLKVYPSDANFILIKVKDGDLIHKELIKEGVLVRNMSHIPKMENCLRVSIGKPEENDYFIEKLVKVYQRGL
jgi:histidinol-phosphate aminotransferase